jgi:hypothetical protein
LYVVLGPGLGIDDTPELLVQGVHRTEGGVASAPLFC